MPLGRRHHGPPKGCVWAMLISAVRQEHEANLLLITVLLCTIRLSLRRLKVAEW